MKNKKTSATRKKASPASRGSAKHGLRRRSALRGDWDDEFGRLLKEIREQEGMTQEELARATGLTAMHISHFECGRRLPCLRSFRELMFALGDYCESLLELRHAGLARTWKGCQLCYGSGIIQRHPFIQRCGCGAGERPTTRNRAASQNVKAEVQP